MLSAEVSGQISRFVAFILGGNREPSAEGHHLVRKLAHFCEFMALGAVSVLLSGEVLKEIRERVLFSAAVGLFVPLTDETLQIFTGRGPSLVDVWIDVSGFCVGCLIILAVTLAVAKKRRRRASDLSING